MYVYLIETEAVHSSAFTVKYGVLMLLRSYASLMRSVSYFMKVIC